MGPWVGMGIAHIWKEREKVFLFVFKDVLLLDGSGAAYRGFFHETRLRAGWQALDVTSMHIFDCE